MLGQSQKMLNLRLKPKAFFWIKSPQSFQPALTGKGFRRPNGSPTCAVFPLRALQFPPSKRDARGQFVHGDQRKIAADLVLGLLFRLVIVKQAHSISPLPGDRRRLSSGSPPAEPHAARSCRLSGVVAVPALTGEKFSPSAAGTGGAPAAADDRIGSDEHMRTGRDHEEAIRPAGGHYRPAIVGPIIRCDAVEQQEPARKPSRILGGREVVGVGNRDR